MRNRLGFCLVFFLAAATTGCRSKSTQNANDLKPRHFFDEMMGADSYTDLFDALTRVDRSHSEFQPVIVAHSTFWNSKLREAYVRERSGRFRYGEEEARTLAVEELQENETFIVFVISVSTREFEWNDLDRPDSMWRIQLTDEAGQISHKPESIKVVSQKDEVSRYFYKHMDSFSRTYRVRFARDPFRGMESFVLRIAGVRGGLQFSFKNDAPTPPAQLESQ